MNNASDNAQLYTPWQPGTFTRARRRRVRLAWSVWLVSAIFVLFQFFLQLSSGEMIGALMHSFDLTALGGGLLASSYYYIYVLLQTPAGMMMDRYGPRAILSVGAAIVSLGSFIFCLSNSVFYALIGRIMMGGGSAFAFVGCLNIISIWFPARRFALMAAIVETAGMIGAIVGNFFLASCIHAVGWRACMMFAAFFAGVLTLFLIFIIRNAPSKRRKINTKHIDLRQGLKKLLTHSMIWLNGIYSGLMFGIITIFIALWAIPFLELTHHMTLVQATLVVSALYVGVAIGGPVIGFIDEKTSYRKLMMIVNALCAAICLFIVIFVTSLSSTAISFILFLTGIFASSYVLTFAIANELAPNNKATAIGFTNMLCVIFAPIFQPLIGFLMTHLALGNSIANFQWALSVLPFMLIGAAGMAFYLQTSDR